MPCYDPRDNWDHSHSNELIKVLENLIEVINRRQCYSEDIEPFKDLSHEATRTLCFYLGGKKPSDLKVYSKQVRHWWIDHEEWDKNRNK